MDLRQTYGAYPYTQCSALEAYGVCAIGEGAKLWAEGRCSPGGDPHEQPGAEPRQIPIPVIFDVPAPCNLSFASNIDVEYFAPMYLGDRITRTSRLVSIKRKTLRVGDGAFLRQEDTYTNQDDVVVAIVNLDIFRFVAPDGRDD